MTRLFLALHFGKVNVIYHNGTVPSAVVDLM